MDPVTLAAALLSALSLASSVGASEAVVRLARRGVEISEGKWKLVIFLWPLLTVAPIAITVFVWSPVQAGFPAREFYRVTAEVIPLLLIALMVEQRLVGGMKPSIRAEFLIVLMAGEIAAFVGVSGIFAGASDPSDPMVGGTSGWTGVVASITGGGLVAGALLVVAAIRLRGSADVQAGDAVTPEGSNMNRQDIVARLAEISHATWMTQKSRNEGVRFDDLDPAVTDHDRERAENTVAELERLGVLRLTG